MNRETGKDRWRRVPKDYFRKPDRLQRTKTRLSWLALVLATGWFASGVDWMGRGASSTDRNSLRANHGELARVHATWDNKCEACHVPFEPIDGRPLLASSSDPSARSSDRLCMSCHAGPAHHKSAWKSDVQGCAECHRDHRGRDASLVRLADATCTECHSALYAHTDLDAKAKGDRGYAARIMSFAPGAHPAFESEFADYANPSKPRDRGKLKFNHGLHMSPGLVRKPGDRPMTIGKIPVVAERGRYGKDPAAEVRLGCSSCHLLDQGDGPAGLPASGPRARGEYYLPIDYRSHCRSCHPLTFDPKTPTLEAPHGVSPAEVSDYLRGVYSAQLLSERPGLLEAYRPPTPLPGKVSLDPTLKKQLEAAIASAEDLLFQDKTNCNECHEYSGGLVRGTVPARIEPTSVPEIWYTHARFDHKVHRAVSCRDCHEKAYATGPDGHSPLKEVSTNQADVLIPGIDNCVKCHAAARSNPGWFGSGVDTTGRASGSCVECHRYHDGDHPQRGPGTVARGPIEAGPIREFLDGAIRPARINAIP